MNKVISNRYTSLMLRFANEISMKVILNTLRTYILLSYCNKVSSMGFYAWFSRATQRVSSNLRSAKGYVADVSGTIYSVLCSRFYLRCLMRRRSVRFYNRLLRNYVLLYLLSGVLSSEV